MSRNLVNNDSCPSYGAMDAPHDVTFSNFSPTEFYNLCESITTDIYTFSSNCKNLERDLKSIGTPKDNVKFRENIHKLQLIANQIVTATTKDITRLKTIVRKGDKQQKLQVDKLTSDFMETFESFNSIQKLIVAKMKANMLVTSHTPSEEQTEEEDSQLMKQQQIRELEFEQEMLLEQEQGISRIESDILDIGQIMRDLSVLVHDQGEVIDSISNNIESTAGNVEQGASELQKAVRYQNKARKKLIILILLALIIVSVFITVIVISTR